MMNLINYGHRDFKSIYHSAIRGAYFGILNAFIVFIPYIYSVLDNKVLMFSYMIIGLIIVLTLAAIPLFYRNKYNYNIAHLRYLLFIGVFNIIFYIGYIYYLYKRLNVKLFTLDAYILILYVLLSIMSAIDIFSCAFKGFKKIKRFYTRTYQKQTFSNIIITVFGVITAVLFLMPQYFPFGG